MCSILLNLIGPSRRVCIFTQQNNRLEYHSYSFGVLSIYPKRAPTPHSTSTVVALGNSPRLFLHNIRLDGQQHSKIKGNTCISTFRFHLCPFSSKIQQRIQSFWKSSRASRYSTVTSLKWFLTDLARQNRTGCLLPEGPVRLTVCPEPFVHCRK